MGRRQGKKRKKNKEKESMLVENQKAKACNPVGRQHSVFSYMRSKEKRRKAESVRATKEDGFVRSK